MRIIYFCLLIVLVVGCDTGKDRSKAIPPAEKTDNPRSAALREEATGQEASRGNTQRRRPPVSSNKRAGSGNGSKISVDDILNGAQYSQSVKNHVQDLKNQGTTEVPLASLNSWIRKLDPLAAYKLLSGKYVPATKAETKPETVEYQYSSEPTTSLRHLQGRAEYLQRGLTHFNQLAIANCDNKTKAKAALFIENVINELPHVESMDAWSALNETANQLEKDGSGLRTDPLFQLCHAITFTHVKNVEGFSDCMDVAFKEFPNQAYPAQLVVFAYQQHFKFPKKDGSSRTAAKRRAGYMLAVNYWLGQDFRAQSHEHRYVYEDIDKFMNLWIELNRWNELDLFMQVFSEHTHLPTWVRCMVRAKYYSRQSWRHRGAGLANSVTQQGWDKFEEFQKKAAGYLQKAQLANPMFPEPAAELIDVCRAGHVGETQDHWFNLSLRGQQDYMPAIHARLFGAVPQWGGSVEEMVSIASTLSERKRTDSMEPFAIVECYFIIQDRVSEELAGKEILRDPDFLAKIYEALDSLVEDETPDVIDGYIRGPRYFLTLKGIIANKAQDFETAHNAFEKIGRREYHPVAARKFGRFTSATFATYRCQAFAATGEFGEEAEQLKELLGDSRKTRTRNTKKILELTESVLREDPDSIGSLYFRKANNLVTMERDYSAGKEVTFGFDPELSLWESLEMRQIEFGDDNTVCIDNRNSSLNFTLTSIVETAGNKMIQFDIEFPDDDQPGSVSIEQIIPSAMVAVYKGTGLSIGLSRSNQVIDVEFGNRMIKFRPGKLVFGQSSHPSFMYSYNLNLLEKTNQLRIFIADGYVEVYVNDQFVFRSFSPNIISNFRKLHLFNPKLSIGRGQFNISNVKLQKWAGPPPLNGPDQDVIAFYKKEVKNTPNDKWDMFWLAQAYHQQGDFEAAIESYKAAVGLGIDKSLAGVYLGDAYDREANYEMARKCYEAAAGADTEDLTKIFKRRHSDLHSHPQNWAAFRLAWLNYSSEDPELRTHDIMAFASLTVPEETKWTAGILFAQRHAIKGEFGSAVSEAQKTLSHCSVELEQRVLEMIEAYQSKKIYIRAPDEPPFYLLVEDSIPFFRRFEDHLAGALLQNYSSK